VIGWLTRPKSYFKGYQQGLCQGYEEGAKEMADYFSEQLIYSINQDAVLRMTADVDTIERVVEIIEAVRDIGKAQS
jgi:CRISPR/Cas system-associated endonuclease Cas3-HD